MSEKILHVGSGATDARNQAQQTGGLHTMSLDGVQTSIEQGNLRGIVYHGDVRIDYPVEEGIKPVWIDDPTPVRMLAEEAGVAFIQE